MISPQEYSAQAEQELHRILDYWIRHTVDYEHGGFYGKIDLHDQVYPMAQKGAVLNSRICWTFSAAFQQTGNPLYLQMARRAYQYIAHHFIDQQFGGVFWTVDAAGQPADTRKQVYAIAFAVYGLSEFYRATNEEAARQLAIGCYRSIVQHAYEPEFGGYLEAFSRNWGAIDDMRLSDKDANERKTMNTHLHVLEAFANLCRIWPDAVLKQQVTDLVHLFLDKILHPHTHHLQQFFNDQWESQSSLISYGHDIEAAWLLLEAAEIAGDETLVKLVRQRSVLIAAAAAEGLDKDGALWHEYDAASGELIKEKHWWPQAEAMVGFLNAWQLSGDQKFFKNSLAAWSFIQQYLIDKKQGEWIWGVYENYHIIAHEDKAGLWKCPYHNGRACMEIMRRIH